MIESKIEKIEKWRKIVSAKVYERELSNQRNTAQDIIDDLLKDNEYKQIKQQDLEYFTINALDFEFATNYLSSVFITLENCQRVRTYSISEQNKQRAKEFYENKIKEKLNKINEKDKQILTKIYGLDNKRYVYNAKNEKNSNNINKLASIGFMSIAENITQDHTVQTTATVTQQGVSAVEILSQQINLLQK